ncbi:hypothetical protein D4A47_01510 [Anaerotruncus massiliensis (ex Liu et al. 2021)]|uniref:Cupin domain-containing protein n=2 Tax=Anaerotruncus TaxID=244127 RepID=A0A498D290_9FIRM|nr:MULTISPECIES: hypothetical protein [Anaerotruncus]MBC3937574.1 hypothetical protein [Anaerotruncus massiliensis (ex Togo et al. 2019)]RLL14684.1 hypothetical protein D4A47_01510 [Anaerotruncus massiliensis (ex Liu et al. 2021)]
MPQKLNERGLAEFGITTNHERMENGEVRFRLTGRDGSSYIRCENTGGPVWENSHSHSALREMVIVQEGCVVFAEYREGTARLRELPPGGWAVTVPGVPHNECLARGTVVHTVKFGDCSHPDWIASPELDALTKRLSFAEALETVRKTKTDA